MNLMGRALSQEKVEAIYRLRRDGKTEREISREVGVGTGTVSVYLSRSDDLQGLDQEHRLRRRLRKQSITIPSGISGRTLHKNMREFDVAEEELPLVFESFSKIRERPADFARRVLRLGALEEETGKSYREVVRDYEVRWNQARGLEQECRRLLGEIEIAERRLKDAQKLVALQDRLTVCGITPDRLGGFIEGHRKLEDLGFTMQVAQIFAASLREMAIKPLFAASELAEQLATHQQLMTAIRKERKAKNALESEIENLRTTWNILDADRNTLLLSIFKARSEQEEAQKTHLKKMDGLREEIGILEKEVEAKRNEIEQFEKELKPLLEKAEEETKRLGKVIEITNPLIAVTSLITDPEAFNLGAGEAARITWAVCQCFRGYVESHRSSFLASGYFLDDLDRLLKRLAVEVHP